MYGKMQFVLVITALSTALAVQAGDQFAVLDADGSGALSKEEAAAMPALADAWDRLDVDADGQLTKDEFSRFTSEEQEMMDMGKEMKDKLSDTK